MEEPVLDSIKYFLKFVSPYKMKVILAIILGFVRNAIPMMLPILIMYTVDNIIGSTEDGIEQKTVLLITMMLASFFIYTIIRLLLNSIVHILPNGLEIRSYMIYAKVYLFIYRSCLYDSIIISDQVRSCQEWYMMSSKQNIL